MLLDCSAQEFDPGWCTQPQLLSEAGAQSGGPGQVLPDHPGAELKHSLAFTHPVSQTRTIRLSYRHLCALQASASASLCLHILPQSSVADTLPLSEFTHTGSMSSPQTTAKMQRVDLLFHDLTNKAWPQGHRDTGTQGPFG